MARNSESSAPSPGAYILLEEEADLHGIDLPVELRVMAKLERLDMERQTQQHQGRLARFGRKLLNRSIVGS